jgi:hypothetical protein
MPERSLGNGAYGCGLYPAIVFPDSEVVTEQNKYSYVTKVASDAEDEFDKAFIIMKVLTANGVDLKLGIFPVEALHCGINVGDLGKFAEAYMNGECNKIVGRQLDRNIRLYNYRDFQGGMDSDSGFGETEYLEYERQQRYKKSYACGIQYPKFDAVLTDVIRKKSPIADPNMLAVYGNTLLTNLRTMHTLNIFHLDIKPDNLCILGPDARFFDWGFSFIGQSLNDYAMQSQILFEANFDKNTFKRGHHWPYYVALTKRYFYFFDTKLVDLVKSSLVTMAAAQAALKNTTVFEKYAVLAADAAAADPRRKDEMQSALNDASNATAFSDAAVRAATANFKKIFVFIDSACLLSAVLRLYEAYDKEYYVQQHKTASAYLLDSYFT